jgi:hypothetical protein
MTGCDPLSSNPAGGRGEKLVAHRARGFFDAPSGCPGSFPDVSGTGRKRKAKTPSKLRDKAGVFRRFAAAQHVVKVSYVDFELRTRSVSDPTEHIEEGNGVGAPGNRDQNNPGPRQHRVPVNEV